MRSWQTIMRECDGEIIGSVFVVQAESRRGESDKFEVLDPQASPSKEVPR